MCPETRRWRSSGLWVRPALSGGWEAAAFPAGRSFLTRRVSQPPGDAARTCSMPSSTAHRPPPGPAGPGSGWSLSGSGPARCAVGAAEEAPRVSSRHSSPGCAARGPQQPSESWLWGRTAGWPWAPVFCIPLFPRTPGAPSSSSGISLTAGSSWLYVVIGALSHISLLFFPRFVTRLSVVWGLCLVTRFQGLCHRTLQAFPKGFWGFSGACWPATDLAGRRLLRKSPSVRYPLLHHTSTPRSRAARPALEVSQVSEGQGPGGLGWGSWLEVCHRLPSRHQSGPVWSAWGRGLGEGRLCFQDRWRGCGGAGASPPGRWGPGSPRASDLGETEPPPGPRHGAGLMTSPPSDPPSPRLDLDGSHRPKPGAVQEGPANEKAPGSILAPEPGAGGAPGPRRPLGSGTLSSVCVGVAGSSPRDQDRQGVSPLDGRGQDTRKARERTCDRAPAWPPRPEVCAPCPLPLRRSWQPWWHMDDPGAGWHLEPQPGRVLNPLSEATDRTHVLLETMLGPYPAELQWELPGSSFLSQQPTRCQCHLRPHPGLGPRMLTGLRGPPPRRPVTQSCPAPVLP